MFETRLIPLKRLDRSRAHQFSYSPNEQSIRAMLEAYDWRRLDINEFSGTLQPTDEGWELRATLKGQVTQGCVISGAPVHQALELDIRRVYLREPGEALSETALPEDFDDDVEEMPQNLDLDDLLCEATLLFIPEYPKLKKYHDDVPWQYEDQQNDADTSSQENTHPFATLKSQLEAKKKR